MPNKLLELQKRWKQEQSEMALSDKLPGYIGAASQGLSFIGDTVGNLNTADYRVDPFNASSMDDLLQMQTQYVAPEAQTTNIAGSALQGVGSGASVGMAFGPLGAVIGAGVGGLVSGVTSAIGNKRNRVAAQQAADDSMYNLNQQGTNITRDMNRDYVTQYAALGGQLNMFADGGQFTNDVTSFDVGGTHESNPLGGIPQGIGANGMPNLVEEGEVKYDDYIFSDRLIADEATLEAVGLPTKYKNKSFGDIADELQKESEERPNDPISQRGLEDLMDRLKEAQEFKKMQQQQKEQAMMQQQDDVMPMDMMSGVGHNQPVDLRDMPMDGMHPNLDIQYPQEGMETYNPIEVPDAQNQMFYLGGNLFDGYGNSELTRQPKRREDFVTSISKLNIPKIPTDPIKHPTLNLPKIPIVKDNEKLNLGSHYLRYAPVVATGLQTLTDAAGWTNKPDYSMPNLIERQAPRMGRVTEKLHYDPLDTRYLYGELGAQHAATRQNIMDVSGANRAAAMAGLTSADYSAGLQAGAIERQAQEYHQAQRDRVADFNVKKQMANLEAERWEQELRTQNIIRAAMEREGIAQRASDVRMANRTNFLQNLTGLGQEAFNRNLINSNLALYYSTNADGSMSYKADQFAKDFNIDDVRVAEDILKGLLEKRETQTTDKGK